MNTALPKQSSVHQLARRQTRTPPAYLSKVERKYGKPEAYPTDSVASYSATLLIPQRVDRLQNRRLEGGEQAENHADGGREADA